MQMVMLFYRCILLATFVSLASCKTSKTEVRKESQLKQTENFLESSRENVNVGITQSQDDYNLHLAKFGYNINLQAKDSATPARMTEYRNGMPFRTIETTGIYTENKSIKDSSIYKAYKELNYKFNRLNDLYKNQETELNYLKQRMKEVTVEGKVLANNFKYGLWFLLLFAVIWVGQSTGIFSVFKRFLKSV